MRVRYLSATASVAIICIVICLLTSCGDKKEPGKKEPNPKDNAAAVQGTHAAQAADDVVRANK